MWSRRCILSLWLLLLRSHCVFTERSAGSLQYQAVDDSKTQGFVNEIETGIDFLMKDHTDLILSRESFFHAIPMGYQAYKSDLMFVQKFIQHIKGLPEDQGDGTHQIVVSGIGNKPAWCYHPFLLRKLVMVEIAIYKILKQSYSSREKGSPFLALESYLLDFESSTMRAKPGIQSIKQGPSNESNEDPFLYIATHPLLIYRMIRRFAEDLQPILHMAPRYNMSIIPLLEKVNPDSLIFPNSEDLKDALESLYRTQHVSDIRTFDMARGIFEGVDTGVHLNALHSLELATYYLKEKDCDYAIQWFYHALEIVKKSPAIIKYQEIQDFCEMMLEHAVETHNKYFANGFNHLWNPGVFNTTVTIPFNPDSYIRRIHQLNQSALEEKKNTVWNWAIKSNFRRVCAGENLQTESEKAALKCWYHGSHNKYWIINPLKVELLSMNPPVFQIYEFIADGLLERMKSHATTKLERSLVVDRSSPTNSLVDSSRTSTQTWIFDNQEEGKFLQFLTKRLELMSGLTIQPLSASDAYQVACYGPSHHYDAHIDSFDDARRTLEKGNRVTTIMGYLNDVNVGGRTGFPVIGVSAKPLKGSIVMWDNIKRNGYHRDDRTWHGGCPVVLGLKWITNKWVYYTDNFLNFPCGLDPDE